MLEKCRKDLSVLISHVGNSVWAWYLVNTVGPTLISRRKISAIISNPPWVKYADIQVKTRKEELRKTFEEEGLWAGGKQAPHNDIAQLFPRICRRIYLQDTKGNPATYIVKRSYLKASQWEKFRESSKDIIWQIWDLDDPQPFGARGSRSPCVLLEYHHGIWPEGIADLSHENVIEFRNLVKNQFPASQMSAKQSLEFLEFGKPRKGIPQGPSEYPSNQWKNGATIFPDILVIIKEWSTTTDPKELYIVTQESRHSPWKNMPVWKGNIPTRWKRSLCKGNDLLPYLVRPNTTQAIIPISTEGNLEPKPEGFPSWEELDRNYRSNRGRSSPETLLARIDYQRVLQKQLRIPAGNEKTTIIYPSSGKIMRAARAKPREILVENSNYYQNFPTADESLYVMAILNSPGLTDAFAHGRKSDRHFHTNVWKCLPIKRFDATKSLHSDLASLSLKAEQATEQWYHSDPEHRKMGQQTASARIREMLAENGISGEIDKIIQKLLPNQFRN